jgi:adenine-specific DNA-methyltransferase
MTIKVLPKFERCARAVVHEGDCIGLLRQIPDNAIQLIVTSPPYNVGKSYESKRGLEQYLAEQEQVIEECVRVLAPAGSICWQVGNYVDKRRSSSIVPLDIALYPIFAKMGLKLRNRVIWHFEHGLHCSKRLSGRHETICWYTKSDDYYFDLDPIRVPQKYPGKKYFKGPKAGQYSGNPNGKNPGDVWIFPNVKSNHVEKTSHPCQFPVELVERLVLSMSKEDQWVLDPFAGVGTTMAAAVRCHRRGAGSELISSYAETARDRIQAAAAGQLRVRERKTPVFDPNKAGAALRTSPWRNGDSSNQSNTSRPQKSESKSEQMRLLEPRGVYEANR